MTDNPVLKMIINAKHQLEEEARKPQPEVYFLHVTPALADQAEVKAGDIVGTFANRPVKIALIEPLPIINLDEIDDGMKIFGAPDNYEKFFLHPAIITGEGKKVNICKNPEDA